MNKPQKKILITGGSGFIGSNLCKRLIQEGYDVTVFDNFSRGSSNNLSQILTQITLIDGDIRSSNDVINACKGMDSVIHLAYLDGTEYFYQKPDLVLDIAVKGMVNILEGVKQNKIPEFVYASSSEVYQTPTQLPTTESVSLVVPDPLNPRYSYGSGKIIGEMMTLHNASLFCDRILIFRPHNVFGANMGFEHVIPQLIKKIIDAPVDTDNTKTIQIRGDGTQTRAFIHIDEFLDGLMVMLNKGISGEIYNIGSMIELSIQDLAISIGQLMDTSIKLITSEAPLGETNRRCPDVSKLQGLGFNPPADIQKGLKDTINWYQQYYQQGKSNDE